MAWIVRTYILVEQDEPSVYDTEEEARNEADHIELLGGGETLARVEEVDNDGNL